MLLEYIKAFAVGGMLCVIGQVLIDTTKLTPARILTCYVVVGAFTGGFTAAAGGICAAVFFAVAVALLFKPKDKNK